MSEGIELHEWRDKSRTDHASRSFHLGEYSSNWASRTYFYLWMFTGVHGFYKQNVRDVSQVIEQIFEDLQERARKSAELDFLGF